MRGCHRTLFPVAGVVVFGLAHAAAAGSIGPVCDTCQGSIYSLATPTATPISTTASTDTWDIISSGTLLSAPGGVGNWNVIKGGIDANGCSVGTMGFGCAAATSVGVSPVLPGRIYPWMFELTMTTGSPWTTGANPSSVDNSGTTVGVIPLLLMGAGFALIALSSPARAPAARRPVTHEEIDATGYGPAMKAVLPLPPAASASPSDAAMREAHRSGSAPLFVTSYTPPDSSASSLSVAARCMIEARYNYAFIPCSERFRSARAGQVAEIRQTLRSEGRAWPSSS